MFSGIVEAIGSIVSIDAHNDCITFCISPSIHFNDVKVGDSISVNGVCLTVTQLLAHNFTVTAVPETLRVTNLGVLKVATSINLERSLAVGARIGGHTVQGHVDFSGEILDLQHDGKAALLAKISNPSVYAKYIVNKGYITLDGMSITVIQATPEWFTVTFIPHTQQVSVVKQYSIGTKINVEVDILGKYVEKLLGAYTK